MMNDWNFILLAIRIIFWVGSVLTIKLISVCVCGNESSFFTLFNKVANQLIFDASRKKIMCFVILCSFSI